MELRIEIGITVKEWNWNNNRNFLWNGN